MKRQRGRNRNNNNNNKNHNNSNRSLDSNGPDVKVRGSASTIYDKYVNLARDASSSGNRVKAENYRQHAEHYLRLVNVQEAAKQAAREEREAKQAAQTAANNDDNTDGNQDDKRRRYPPRVRGNKDDKAQASSDTPTSDGLEVVTPEGTKPKAKTKKAANGEAKAAASKDTTEDKPKTTRRRKAPAKPEAEDATPTAAAE